MNKSAYWLVNVLLETGYRYEDGDIVGTDAQLHHICIEDGRIASVAFGELPEDGLPRRDAAGLLLLPAFREMHIHIDKTYYGGPWKAVRPANGVFGRIEEERELLPKLLPTAQQRAEKMLEMLLGFGSTHVRTHCNIDPVVGLRNMEAAMRALDTYSGKLSHEVVAFPQHGLLRSDAVELVREAMRQGATHVGAVDPATVDGDIDRSLQTVMDIAIEADAGVDIHVHDGGDAGLATMRRVAELTEQAGWQGRVTVSHAFAFAGDAAAAAELAGRFAELGISITSTVPFGGLIMPLPMMHAKGVAIGLGNDSITDHWSPFGIGDCLEKAGRLAELYRFVGERSLAQSLGYITGGVTPLDAEGRRVWPATGDAADVVLVQASCSAEAVARRAERKAVLFGGELVAGALEKR